MPDPLPSSSEPLQRVLPRGRHALSREVVRASQRQRLIEAMAEVTADKGYASVTIADIVARAGTARRVFYDHFRDKEECFLVAFGQIVDNVIDAISGRFDPALDQAGRAEIVIRGFLGFLAANPVFAWTYLVDVNTIGQTGIARSLEVRRRIAEMLVALREDVRLLRPDTPRLSQLQALAIVGAVHEIVDQAIHERGPERLMELCDELVALAVAMLDIPAPELGPH